MLSQDGELDKATEEKLRLEEKQRQARKERKVMLALAMNESFRQNK